MARALHALRDSRVVAQIGSLHIRKGRNDATLLDPTLQICTPRLAPNAVAADSFQP